MKKIFLFYLCVFLLCTNISFATNITIPDLNSSSSNSWYGTHEDQEVEPGMARSQAWDLEGFFVNGTVLSLVGGYDFKNGAGSGKKFYSGDIFIDITGDAVYGNTKGSENGNRQVANTFGYDYVLDLDWDNLTYDLYGINGNSKVLTAYYKQNQGSSPWRYDSGGTLIYKDKNFDYITGLTDGQTGFLGGLHNKLSMDLSFLNTLTGNAHTDFTVHYTMGCGNDNIMGYGTIPNPEPATMILLGFGLIGIAGIGRKIKS
jgi:hypothetical protein